MVRNFDGEQFRSKTIIVPLYEWSAAQVRNKMIDVGNDNGIASPASEEELLQVGDNDDGRAAALRGHFDCFLSAAPCDLENEDVVRKLSALAFIFWFGSEI